MIIEKMKSIREEQNLLQKDVAKTLNMSLSTYAMNECGLDTITLKNLANFCDHFDCSLDYIFSLNNLKKYSNMKKGINRNLIGVRLKEIRLENKYTQEMIGNLLNIDHSVWCRYEKGTTLISTTFLYTFAKHFNVSIDYLLGRIEKTKYL